MAAVVFRCPVVGMIVQGWTRDDDPDETPDHFVGIECVACKQTHLVNAATGRVLGEQAEDEPPRSGR